jgi:hypothetical protein
MIEHRDGGFWIKDLGSTNGTAVNDEPLTRPRLLKDNDLICLGGASTLEFHFGGSKKSENIKTEVGDTPLPKDPKVNAPTTKEHAALPVPPPPAPPTPTPPTPPHPPAPPKPDFPLGAILAILAIVSAGGVLAVLYATGVIGSQREPTDNFNRETPTPTQVSENRSPDGRVTPEPAPTPAVLVVDPTPTAPDPNDPPDGEVNPATVRQLAQNLTLQITGKNLYVIDANFATLISQRLDEYRAVGYYERAQKYRQPISIYLGSRGSMQLVAYVIAMSQTKFNPKGAGGVWFKSLPQAVVSEAGGDTADIDGVALKHLGERLDNFGRDDFIYAVACYGMSGDDAGKFAQALRNADPEEKDRYDFWKMKNKRVVNGEQVELVVRFFAAGIVAENPGLFNLKDAQLSKLMN